MTDIRHVPLWIDGGARPAEAGASFDDIAPATGEPLARVDAAGPADVDAAVAAARRGLAVWRRTPGAERGRVLLRAAEILRARRGELAAIETRDTGKPIAESTAVDVDSGADCLEYFGGASMSLQGEHIDHGGAFTYTRREPLGVCAGIGAWNYPLQIACWKSAPALACGNAMVFKPAEQTPLSAMELAAALRDAGLPDGVFNVVHGARDTGELLSRHGGIAKVSVTGEVATGKRVMTDAAGTLKRVTMELGGKSPLIVFDDADLDQAVAGALMANFFTQGEVCTNGTRVFVHDAVRDAFVDHLALRASRLRVGDPMDPATQIGALISREHMDRVLGHVAAARREGARVACGGEPVTVPGCEGGAFVAPTVLTGCRDDMAAVREEIFGPVLAVLGFSGEDEVIARANDTDYGLAAGVFTRDLSRAHRVCAELEAGICWVNDYNVTPIAMPFGGVKQSGIGRENGRAALEHYTQLKSVYVNLGDVDCPY